MSKGESGSDDLEETLKLLGLVRTGKMCEYVLGFKGSSVEALILKKKKLSGGDLTAAGKGGRTTVTGMVSGQGANITFFVSKADGFAELPAGGKPEKLKVFLNELTEAKKQKWTPAYELVDESPLLPFDADDLKNPLIARFAQLQGVTSKVLESQPSLEAEIGRHVRMIHKLLGDEKTIDGAGPKIDEFANLLKKWLGATPTVDAPKTDQPQQTPAPTQQVVTDEEHAQKLAESLKKLKGLAEKVIETAPNRKGELFEVIGRIALQIKNKEFDRASQDLVAFGKLLQSALAGPTPVGSEFDQMQDLTQRRQALEPLLLEARRADPEKAAKLGTLWDYAEKQAGAGHYANANKALDGLENAITEILAAQQAKQPTDAQRYGIQAGLVAERVNELEDYIIRHLGDLRSAGIADVGRLTKAMQTMVPEDADMFHDGIIEQLDELYDEVREDLARTVQMGMRSEIVDAITRWRATIAQDPLIQHLATTKQALQVETTIGRRFDELFQAAITEVERVPATV